MIIYIYIYFFFFFLNFDLNNFSFSTTRFVFIRILKKILLSFFIVNDKFRIYCISLKSAMCR